MHSQAVEISLCLFSALGYALPQWPTSENPAIEVENILQARAFIDACQLTYCNLCELEFNQQTQQWDFKAESSSGYCARVAGPDCAACVWDPIGDNMNDGMCVHFDNPTYATVFDRCKSEYCASASSSGYDGSRSDTGTETGSDTNSETSKKSQKNGPSRNAAGPGCQEARSLYNSLKGEGNSSDTTKPGTSNQSGLRVADISDDQSFGAGTPAVIAKGFNFQINLCGTFKANGIKPCGDDAPDCSGCNDAKECQVLGPDQKTKLDPWLSGKPGICQPQAGAQGGTPAGTAPGAAGSPADKQAPGPCECPRFTACKTSEGPRCKAYPACACNKRFWGPFHPVNLFTGDGECQ